MSEPLARGAVVWVDFSPTVGLEQRGTRPALAVSSAGYLDSVRDLVIVVPITSVDRGWPHHVPVRGEQTRLPQAGFAMIEQPRTSSVARICRRRAPLAACLPASGGGSRFPLGWPSARRSS